MDCGEICNESASYCSKCRGINFVHGENKEELSSASPQRKSEVTDVPISQIREEVNLNSQLKSKSGQSTTKVINPNSEVIDLLQKNIEASNRTTHSIRALVRFLFLQLTFTTVALFFYSIASSSENPNGLLILLAVIIWITGIIISSNIGWQELSKSDVPGASSGKSLSL